MFLIGLGTATPPRCYTQRECWDTLLRSRAFGKLAGQSQALLRKVLLGNSGITTRHLVLDPLSDAFLFDPNTLAERFARHAPALATEAAARALRSAGLTPAQVDGLVVSTCTGYLCPGLSSYVVERLGLNPTIRALDLVGHGCGAALPNLQTAAAWLGAGQCQRVVSICVEVCSAAFYLDDDPGVLVSACLFGDGAAAAVCGTTPGPGARGVEYVAGGGKLSPADRDHLRFELRDGMLRNVLSKEAPALAARLTAEVLAETLPRTNVPRQRLTGWILHPGGRNVLEALRDKLGLREDDLRWSAEVLQHFGNVSSASVLFALERALAGGARGGYWWMSSFGAGFSAYGALLRVEP